MAPTFRVVGLALLLGAAPAFAQSAADFQALEKQVQELQARVNKLQQEQADSTVSYSGAVPASVIQENKIKLASDVTELKLYGDLRFRYQYDQFHPVLASPAQVTDERNRVRFRLRIGADVQIGDQFFAGVTLATNQGSDSNSQTYTEGYDNYNIYIDKAFAGWTPNDWFTLVIGKQANPLYTTDLVWGSSINPSAAVEVIDLSKAFMPDNSRLSLQLISLQGAFEGGSSFSLGNDTAWQFVEQLKGTYHFNKDVSVTFAPGFMTYTAASLSGLQNTQDFSKPTDELTAPNGIQTTTTTVTTNTRTIKYSATGVPTVTITPVNTTTTTTVTSPATGPSRTVTTTTSATQTQVIVKTTLPTNKALANRTFVTTSTVGGGSTTVTTPTGAAPAQETRDLSIITAPGDVSFKIGGLDAKVYWDFAYNADGASRAGNEYLLGSHSPQDDFAWLAGVQIGDNIHTGDWSFYANYRQVGMDSIDPNLNDNDFALSYLNVQGIKTGIAYNFTDSFVGAITYFRAWDLRHGLTGGEATGGAQLANAKSVDTLQVDLNLKF